MMWAICFIFPGQLSVAFVRIVGWLANFFFISNNLFYHFRVNFNGTKFFPDTVGWKAKLKVLNEKLEWKVCKLNLKTNNDPYTVLTNNCWGEFIFGIWNTIHFEHLNLNIKLLSRAAKWKNVATQWSYWPVLAQMNNSSRWITLLAHVVISKRNFHPEFQYLFIFADKCFSTSFNLDSELFLFVYSIGNWFNWIGRFE